LERPTRDPAGPSAGDGVDPGTWSESTWSACEDGPADSDMREEGPAQDPPPAGDRASENWSGLDALVTAAALATAAPAVAGATGSGQAGAPKAALVGPSEAMAGSPFVSGDGGGSATPNPPEGSTGAGGPHGDVGAAASRAAKPPVQLCFGMDKVGRTSTVKAFLEKNQSTAVRKRRQPHRAGCLSLQKGPPHSTGVNLCCVAGGHRGAQGQWHLSTWGDPRRPGHPDG